MRSVFLLVAMLVTLAATTSCSSFHRQWRQAAAQPASNDFTGAWEGQWVSTASGHEGKLRCLVSPSADAEPGSYDFHYWAKWGLLSGDFAASYPVTRVSPNRWTFVGESDLGSLGGVYRHEGETTVESFKSEYTSSRGDRGYMEMTRP